MRITWKDYLEHEKVHTEDPKKTQQFFNYIIESFCPELKLLTGSALEIGIGQSGGYLGILGDQFDYTVSLDPLFGEIKEKAEEMSFPDESFDLVIISNTLSHCDDPSLVAKQISRVLKKDGIVFLFNYYNEDQFHPHVYTNKKEITTLFSDLDIFLAKEMPSKKGRSAFLVMLAKK